MGRIFRFEDTHVRDQGVLRDALLARPMRSARMRGERTDAQLPSSRFPSSAILNQTALSQCQLSSLTKRANEYVLSARLKLRAISRAFRHVRQDRALNTPYQLLDTPNSHSRSFGYLTLCESGHVVHCSVCTVPGVTGSAVNAAGALPES